MVKCKSAFVGIVTKLFDITGKALSGEWGTDDPDGCGIPVLRTTNFTNVGKVNYDNVVTRNIQKKNISDKLLKKGDIIIEKSGGTDKNPVGRVIYFEGEENKYLFNNFTGLLRVKDKNEWYPKYVFYSMFAYYKRGGTRRFENKTTGLHNLKLDDYIKRLDIQKASYVDQVHVCKLLDCVRLQIDNMERELELLDELVKARFVEMFGDPIENTYSFPILKLGELSELITKGASPSWQGYSYTEDSTQTLFVTSENVREGYMDFSSIKYVEDAFNEKQKRSMIQKGDYLINIVGASIGRAAQFNMDCKANMNQAAALVRIKDNTISDNYLLYYLNSDKAQMMYNSMKSDTGRANLSLQDIANLEILVPDLTLQVKFASFVQEIDKSRLLSNHSLFLIKSITF